MGSAFKAAFMKAACWFFTKTAIELAEANPEETWWHYFFHGLAPCFLCCPSESFNNIEANIVSPIQPNSISKHRHCVSQCCRLSRFYQPWYRPQRSGAILAADSVVLPCPLQRSCYRGFFRHLDDQARCPGPYLFPLGGVKWRPIPSKQSAVGNQFSLYRLQLNQKCLDNFWVEQQQWWVTKVGASAHRMSNHTLAMLQDFSDRLQVHLIAWQHLAAMSQDRGLMLFKLRPKHHSCDHLREQVARTRINPRLAMQCFGDESFLGFWKRIGISCHSSSILRRIYDRYLLYISLRWRDARDSWEMGTFMGSCEGKTGPDQGHFLPQVNPWPLEGLNGFPLSNLLTYIHTYTIFICICIYKHI